MIVIAAFIMAYSDIMHLLFPITVSFGCTL